MDPELRAYLDETRRHFDGATEQMQGQLQETRRHFDVVAEQMRGQLQLVTEGVSSLADRLDRAEHNLREEILRVQRELSAMIRFSYTELDRRIQGLESR